MLNGYVLANSYSYNLFFFWLLLDVIIDMLNGYMLADSNLYNVNYIYIYIYWETIM